MKIPKIPKGFGIKDRRHLEAMNREFGEMCSRLGKLEGRIDEGFSNIASNMKWIERRFVDLQCNKHAEIITDLENKIANMEGRTWVWDKNRRALIVFILGVVTTLIGAYFAHVLRLFGS